MTSYRYFQFTKGGHINHLYFPSKDDIRTLIRLIVALLAPLLLLLYSK
jgi:hypothetical protein